jgi:hypothetical protein
MRLTESEIQISAFYVAEHRYFRRGKVRRYFQKMISGTHDFNAGTRGVNRPTAGYCRGGGSRPFRYLRNGNNADY